MQQGKNTGKFYCSRCKAIHADGTLRFCADCGGRLVPAESPKTKNLGIGGMFSKLMNKDSTGNLDSGSLAVESQVEAPVEQEVHVPVIRGITPMPSRPVGESAVATAVNERAYGSTAPLSGPESEPRPTTELSTGDLVSVTAATQQEASINLSTGPLKFESLGPQAKLSPEQLARLASTGELKLLIGKKISDRFLINELLAGGIGRATYTAVDLQTNGKVLVQMFPGEAFDARSDSNVYGEALRNVARFREGDFAAVLGSGRLPDGRVVIISEYVEGNSVAQVIGFAGAFDVNRAARLVRKIADAVNEAHQYGVFHGSLRAENVVLLRPEDLQDKIKIIGLGVSLADGEVLSSGIPSAADDAYDLAVIAYQMLTGRNPFPGPSTDGTSSLGTIVPARSIRSELPQQVDYVLGKALSRISAERYADVRDFGDSFYAALTGGMSVSGRLTRQEEEPVPESDVEGRSERIQVRELFAKEPKSETAPVEVVQEAEVVESEEESEFKRRRRKLGFAAAFLLILGGIGYFAYQYQNPVGAPSVQSGNSPSKTVEDGPIVPRKLDRPAGSEVFVNNAAGLSSELSRNFMPFQIFYPKGYTKNSPGKHFLDLAELNGDGQLVAKFLVTRYESFGTFQQDKQKFPELVEGSNGDLRSQLGPSYRPVYQGETTLQSGRLKAYEVKFEAASTDNKTKIWGRRFWIPLQRQDAKSGFVITLLATDQSKDVKGLDDVGEKGPLKAILDSFEPGK